MGDLYVVSSREVPHDEVNVTLVNVSDQLVSIECDVTDKDQTFWNVHVFTSLYSRMKRDLENRFGEDWNEYVLDLQKVQIGNVGWDKNKKEWWYALAHEFKLGKEVIHKGDDNIEGGEWDCMLATGLKVFSEWSDHFTKLTRQ